MTEAKACGTGE